MTDLSNLFNFLNRNIWVLGGGPNRGTSSKTGQKPIRKPRLPLIQLS